MGDDYTGYTGMISIDQGYDRGEILLAPAQKADVVIVPQVVPQGVSADELTMIWKDYARGRHKMH